MAAIDKKLIEDLKKDSETKGQRIDDLVTGQKRVEGYMIGIVIVSAFGFMTLLLTGWSFFSDSLHFKASTYQVLIDKVDQVNEKLENQKQTLNKNQIDLLQTQINDLKQKNPYLK